MYIVLIISTVYCRKMPKRKKSAKHCVNIAKKRWDKDISGGYKNTNEQDIVSSVERTGLYQLTM